MLKLAVKKRKSDGASPRALRRIGELPGVVYGPNHSAEAISIAERDFSKVFKEAGESAVVELTGLGESVPTLIYEVDLDPLTNLPRHVDFYAITKGEKVEVEIPLEYIGESPAVSRGANLVKVLHELEIEADPMNLPHGIKVDISVLVNLDDQIHAKDLKLPPGVTLVTDPEEVVALVQEVKEEVEEVAPADLSSIEVEKKGKEEEAAVEGGEREGK